MDYKMGTRIRDLRKSNDMKIEYLAEILNVTPAFLGAIERNKRGTIYQKLEKLCSIFNVSADYLLFGKDDLRKYEEKDYNTFINEVLYEEERRFILEVVKILIHYRLSNMDFEILQQAISAQANLIIQVKNRCKPINK